jgi:hypothetical protein
MTPPRLERREGEGRLPLPIRLRPVDLLAHAPYNFRGISKNCTVPGKLSKT